jgi:hypothetical protein
MEPYGAFLVPGGLAIFVAIVGIVSVILERRRAAARIRDKAKAQAQASSAAC